MLSFIKNHKLGNRVYSESEISYMYLTYLCDLYYATAITSCEVALLHVDIPEDDYLVLVIARNIEQLCLTRHHTRDSFRIHSSPLVISVHVWSTHDPSIYDESTVTFLDTTNTDRSTEHLCVRYFCAGGGHTPFVRNVRRGRDHYIRDHKESQQSSTYNRNKSGFKKKYMSSCQHKLSITISSTCDNF